MWQRHLEIFQQVESIPSIITISPPSSITYKMVDLYPQFNVNCEWGDSISIGRPDGPFPKILFPQYWQVGVNMLLHHSSGLPHPKKRKSESIAVAVLAERGGSDEGGWGGHGGAMRGCSDHCPSDPK